MPKKRSKSYLRHLGTILEILIRNDENITDVLLGNYPAVLGHNAVPTGLSSFEVAVSIQNNKNP